MSFPTRPAYALATDSLLEALRDSLARRRAPGYQPCAYDDQLLELGARLVTLMENTGRPTDPFLHGRRERTQADIAPFRYLSTPTAPLQVLPGDLYNLVLPLLLHVYQTAHFRSAAQ